MCYILFYDKTDVTKEINIQGDRNSSMCCKTLEIFLECKIELWTTIIYHFNDYVNKLLGRYPIQRFFLNSIQNPAREEKNSILLNMKM